MNRYEVRSLANSNLLGYIHAEHIDDAWDIALIQYTTLVTLNSIANPTTRRSTT